MALFGKKKSEKNVKKKSISRRLSSSLVLCMAIICLFFIITTYFKKMNDSNKILAKKAKEYEKLITSSLSVPLWDIDRDSIQEIGTSYMQHNLISRLLIVDQMNRVLFSDQKQKRDSAIPHEWNIFYNQETIGRVEMDVNAEFYHQKNKEMFVSSLLTMLVAVLMISLTTGFFLKAILKKPFEELGVIVESYSQGNYDKNKNQTSYIEFDQFVKVLTQMALKIIKQNEELEQRVTERTKELNEANKDLKRLAILAEEANKAKSEFLTNVSHELRTPMNGIMGMASILEDLGLDESYLQCVTIIQSSARDLLSLINDLLDYSSLNTGQLELNLTPFNLEETVSQILKIFEIKAQNKSLQLKHTFAKDIPEKLYGDPIRLQQIIANLMNNAIKFTETGEINVNVCIQLDTTDETIVLFQVIDTGIGILQEDMKHLFKLFSQIDGSVTRKYGGTGLGLVISKKLVQLMGGDINVKSEKDKGSTFWFTLSFNKQPPSSGTNS
jgi:signal transduction histidine kinase